MTLNYITGYAGTGKSYRLAHTHQNSPDSVLLAPTHKALQRLRELYDSYNLKPPEMKTLHSLLGWIPVINEHATSIDAIDTVLKLNKSIDSYTTFIIDEAGMMSEEMLLTITSLIEEANDYNTDHVTLYLYLDPYQLLPVRGKQIELDPLTTTNLTTQYRSESPDIVKTYTKFVHYIDGTNTKDLTIPYSTNIVPLNIANFRQGDRLLAYTNAAVGMWNKIIAKQFHQTSYLNAEVQLGNRLDTVTVRRYIKPSLQLLLNLYKSKQLILQNTHINTKYLKQSLQALIDNEHIKFIVDENELIYPVIEGIGEANIILKQAKIKALQNKHYFVDVYALGRAFVMDYTYATTVHKAQGSEFNTVFIDKDDIKKSIYNGYYIQYARLMYVALSRAIKKIYI